MIVSVLSAQKKSQFQRVSPPLIFNYFINPHARPPICTILFRSLRYSIRDGSLIENGTDLPATRDPAGPRVWWGRGHPGFPVPLPLPDDPGSEFNLGPKSPGTNISSQFKKSYQMTGRSVTFRYNASPGLTSGNAS